MAGKVGLDATVIAIPGYFASMAAERKWLQQRADAEGPSPADYDKPDTIASLSMGVASLFVPLVTGAVAHRYLHPGKGRLGRAVLGTAVGAAIATTVADRLVQRDASVADEDLPEPRRKVRRWARRVARVSGPTAVVAGGVATTTWMADRTDVDRMWRKGQAHDRGGGPLAWALAIAGWDLVYYWNHRMMHEVRGMWAIHVVHHSSQRYNLSTALRQPVADSLGVWVPYGLLARAGIRPNLIQQARGINLLYQYWIHTDTIRSIGRGEEVLNTPSHHRVHHGMNPKYIDRNHGSILIVWDRLFGTFQREEEPVVYGLTKNVGSYAPGRIATHEYQDILRDVSESTTWRERLSFVLRGPGWAYTHTPTGRAVV